MLYRLRDPAACRKDSLLFVRIPFSIPAIVLCAETDPPRRTALLIQRYLCGFEVSFVGAPHGTTNDPVFVGRYIRALPNNFLDAFCVQLISNRGICALIVHCNPPGCSVAGNDAISATATAG